MPKITNVRERVHQPFRDNLVRASGYAQPNPIVQDRMKLFATPGGNEAMTNLSTGSVLPSDQSMVILVLRVFLWFRNSIVRGGLNTLADGVTTILNANGDYALPGAAASPAFAAALNGQAIGDIRDVHRLYWGAAEQILWSFGAGDKFSVQSMPSHWMPAGGGLHGDIGTSTDLLLWNNGVPSTESILRLGRAILLPPRQNIKAESSMQALDDRGNGGLFQATQGTRNMLSLRDNLNAVDLINKVITLTFEGIYSRDVQ
jgi:hypothetical protein